MPVHRKCLYDGRTDKVVVGRAAAAQLQVCLWRVDRPGKRGVAFVTDGRVGGQTVILETLGVTVGVNDSLAADDCGCAGDVELQTRPGGNLNVVACSDIDVAGYP